MLGINTLGAMEEIFIKPFNPLFCNIYKNTQNDLLTTDYKMHQNVTICNT